MTAGTSEKTKAANPLAVTAVRMSLLGKVLVLMITLLFEIIEA
jgi:hypothetical protein